MCIIIVITNRGATSHVNNCMTQNIQPAIGNINRTSRSWNAYVKGINMKSSLIIFFFCRDSPQWARASSFTRFLNHTQRRTTGGRTPLEEWSARRRDLYMTTHNTHNIQTSMPPVGFEPTISAGERPQTYVLDRAAIGTDSLIILLKDNVPIS